ncbi:hypothetical protein DPEC_G00231160 [Dallia pectoralis]|uniref:Uncharacterized protein n=1 Tax=Dallia pectoralis TaxID=75939 RepID=A0ACC2FX57_DALPE|nr:hypothetical protein DPEC_G00231160 [Dallia pectoralis]
MFSLLAVIALLAAGYALIQWYIKLPRCNSATKLHGKTVIVTGSNTGIGKTTAIDLARRGARVIMACRDRLRAEAAIRDIKKETGNHEVVFMELDLASLQSVRSFAENFLKSEPRLDILINNAGLMHSGKTKDGVGMIFGVNHLAHFLLTVLLLDRLKECGPSRVVTVSSTGYTMGKIDFNCLSTHKDLAVGETEWALFQKYCHSKLCNVLFTHELAKRLDGTNVTCYSLHPGGVKTELGRHAGFWWRTITTPIVALCFVDAESGAQTTLHCALQEGIESLSGRYFSSCALQELDAKARDDAVAKKLWEVSEPLCGLS